MIIGERSRRRILRLAAQSLFGGCAMTENPDDKNGRTAPGKLASWYRRGAAIAVWLVACCIATHDASAERFSFDKLTLTQHKAQTLEIPTPFAMAMVGAPDIADTLPISDRLLYIQGKKAGTTNISIFGPDKELIGSIEVEVSVDVPMVANVIKTNLRNSKISVSGAGNQIVLREIGRAHV